MFQSHFLTLPIGPICGPRGAGMLSLSPSPLQSTSSYPIRLCIKQGLELRSSGAESPQLDPYSHSRVAGDGSPHILHAIESMQAARWSWLGVRVEPP